MPRRLSRLEAPAGAASAARGPLAEAAAAARRMRRDADRDALHDLRVALRRFATRARAYRTALRGTIPAGRAARAAKSLIERTGAARDRQVQAGLRARLCAPPPSRPKARTSLSAVLRAVRELEAELAPALETAAGLSLGAPRFGPFACAHLSRARARWTRALARAMRSGRPADLHRARVAGKKVRYLLEPLLAEPGAAALVLPLRSLQAALGEIHDLDVMAEDGLVRAAARGERLRTLSRLRAQWDLARRRAFARSVDRLCRSIH